MPRKGHSQEKIVYALKQAEAGVKTGEICREQGISEQTFCNWGSTGCTESKDCKYEPNGARSWPVNNEELRRWQR